MRPPGSHPDPLHRSDPTADRLTRSPPLLAGSPPPTSPACSLLSFPFLKKRGKHLLTLAPLPPLLPRPPPAPAATCPSTVRPSLPAAGHFRAAPAAGPSFSSWRFPLGGRPGFNPALCPPFGRQFERRGGSLVLAARRRRRRRQRRRRVIFGRQGESFFFPPGFGGGRKEAAASTRDVHGLDLAVRRRGSERGFGGGGIGWWSLSSPHFE